MERIALALAGLIAFATQPCMPTGDLEPTDDTAETSEPAETGDSYGMGPCESGLCDVTVTDARVECASDTTSAPYPLEVTASGPGTLTLWHHRVQQGCCPELSVTAIQDLRHDRIEVSYYLYDDMCDCICDLDVHYTLADLYSGSFELEAQGETLSVTVE
jgi:hypothetical protein